jgi:hypothetical protein
MMMVTTKMYWAVFTNGLRCKLLLAGLGHVQTNSVRSGCDPFVGCQIKQGIVGLQQTLMEIIEYKGKKMDWL